ncbi:uncharacterized protein LOC131948946 [Physella acuta]|uniref:uncharacterized protein LOC131948946 n=1 Tax=Physella acuta TaxID=109671 RepID=UPI0027DAE293|nr:uncharacterized protein LOC131948946 [Physella acuta]
MSGGFEAGVEVTVKTVSVVLPAVGVKVCSFEITDDDGANKKVAAVKEELLKSVGITNHNNYMMVLTQNSNNGSIQMKDEDEIVLYFNSLSNGYLMFVQKA